MSEVPQVLYKYYPPPGIKYVLERQTLRFSSPATFNDVFDCRYLSGRRDHGVRQFTFRQSLGVVCLTDTPTNHLMWVHYAQGHRGFVLGFDTAHEFFQINRPRRVAYDPAPPTVEESADPDLALTVHKASDWTYEREWRIVKEFTQSESRDIEFPFSALREVVLGAEMEKSPRAQVVHFFAELRSRNLNIQLYQARPNPKSWTIGLEPSFLLPCPTCHNTGLTHDARGRCHTCNGSRLAVDAHEITFRNQSGCKPLGH